MQALCDTMKRWNLLIMDKEEKSQAIGLDQTFDRDIKELSQNEEKHKRSTHNTK